MEAGRLRHRITIQQVAEAQDTYGEPIKTWSTFAQRWAAINQVTGKENFNASQFAPDATTRVELRYLAGVTPKMRVKFGTRTFEIKAVLNNMERDVELTLLCLEHV